MESAKMKIALAVTLAESGGVQQFLAGFSVWLKNQGHDVTVLAGDGEWLKERCVANHIPFIHLKKMGREIDPLRDPSAILELRRVLKDLKPDAVELNSAKMSIVGSIAARLAGVPRVVYRIGGWTFREVLPAHKLWIYRNAERVTGKLKDVIICVNPDDVRLANEVGIKAREAVIAVPNGIDLPRFDTVLKPRDVSRDMLQASGFVFGTTANFFPPKDLPRYMEACKLVHDAEPNARFLVLGDGLQRKEIETKRHELGLDEIVWLPGARNDAGALLAGFDAFVLPSSKEGMSFSLLEAMAARLPCIATDVGAAKWMLADAGLVVPKMDPKALAEAMLRVMREPELRAKLAQNARHQIETRFPLLETYRGNLKALLG
ncbi:glycosyltransferase family 4 protein [Patescibacteria group bacterium]|jgi:glycosyltransferase involved in cell wall biosynthesis|nr:glycosyltransferase family 4 protein [Patescibacteria group bacterium]